jgi:hypothetical protein
MAAGSGPPYQACIVNHRTDKLLTKQNTIIDWQAISPYEEGSYYKKK